MKITTCVLSLISSIQLLNAQAYVLDREGYEPPKGFVKVEKTSIVLGDGKLEITANEQVTMKGGLKRTMRSEESITYLGGKKMLTLLKEDLSESEATIAGRKMPKESEEGVLKGIEILYQKVDDKWIGGAKDKKVVLTDEQKKEVEEKLEDLNKERSLYGYEFRSVGDSWDMKKSLLSKIGGDGELEKAEGKMTFLKVEEVNGLQCAKLLCKFDVIGTKDDTKVGFKGEVTVWRSLKYFTDVKARGSLETIVEPVAEEAKIKITGNSVVTEDNLIKLPELAK